MRQGNRKKYISIFVLLLFLTNMIYLSGNAGILKQPVELAEETDKKESPKANKSNGPTGRTTAIVNLDEGTNQSDEIRNYGNELINTLTADIKTTGLEEARAGIENGTYDAYIIVPNSFSRQVAMINEKPEKAMLTYAISPELELLEREKTLEKVVNIYHTFSNSLSQVYTSSIIKEYHEVQDSADEIMDRDKLEMERLLAINGYDLVELIEIPEIETVEDNTSKLDLSDYYAANDAEIANISSAYQTFYENGQKDFDVIKSDTETGKEKEKATGNNIDTVSKHVNQIKPKDYDDTVLAAEEDTKYQEYRDELIDEVSEADDKKGLLDIHNNNLEKFNTSVAEQSAQYDHVQTQYKAFRDALEPAKTASEAENPGTGNEIGNAVLSDTYEFFLISQVESMVTVVASELKRVDGLVERTISQNSISQNGLPEGLPLYPEGTPLEEYEDYVKGLLDEILPTEIKSFYPQIPVTPPSVSIDGKESDKMKPVNTQEVGEKIDNIIKKAKKGRAERNNQYKTMFRNYTGNISTIQEQVTNIETAFKDQSLLFSLIEGNVSSYDLASYIDDKEIDGYASGLEKNNEDIEQKVHENTEEYEKYAEEVYRATDNNIETLQKNIEEGQEKSEKKLEEGLEEAKEFRQSSNEKNVSILKSFSQRLSYTRLGELENKEVYNFIAEPVLLDNQSDPAIVSAVSNKADKPSSSMADVNSASGVFPNWFFLLAIVAVLLLGSSYIAIRVIKAKKQEEF